MSAPTKERPILFKGEMVRAILDGRKTVTRRIVKADVIYRLTDERLSCIHSEYDNIHSNTSADSDFSERRLHGRFGRADLLAHEIQGLWEKGIRGLVCLARAPKREGVLVGVFVPREQEGNEARSPAYLHGISRDAQNRHDASSTPEWEAGGQPAGESGLGDTSGELARPPIPRNSVNGRKTLGGKADGCREATPSVGDFHWPLQSEASRKGARHVPVIHWKDMPFTVGQTLWVRETWQAIHPVAEYVEGYATGYCDDLFPADKIPQSNQSGYWAVMYEATDSMADEHKDDRGYTYRPSIHMPRWACRLVLEVVSVRAERLQDITEEDALAEGVTIRADAVIAAHVAGETPARMEFWALWQSINSKRPGCSWEANPWVWRVEFKRVPAVQP